MKKVVITLGPIPARLDSVKYITNKFRGRLSAKMANEVAKVHKVIVIKHFGTEVELDPSIEVLNVRDVEDYVETVLAVEADAYVLAAAVANLAVVTPWKGKFPSHNYAVGDEFDIKFKIAPRVVDEIKKRRPRATLIAYKLLDSDEAELVRAGFQTMRDSKANLVFCNSPSSAPKEKIALTADGGRHKMSFDEHVKWILRCISLQHYKRGESDNKIDDSALYYFKYLVSKYSDDIFVKQSLLYGSVAVKSGSGIFTTIRGKSFDDLTTAAYVSSIDFQNHVVYSSRKATSNANTLHRLLHAFEDATICIHTHRKACKDVPVYDYVFPGTSEEDLLPASRHFEVKGHGQYIVCKSESEILPAIYGN